MSVFSILGVFSNGLYGARLFVVITALLVWLLDYSAGITPALPNSFRFDEISPSGGIKFRPIKAR